MELIFIKDHFKKEGEYMRKSMFVGIQPKEDIENYRYLFSKSEDFGSWPKEKKSCRTADLDTEFDADYMDELNW